MAEGRNLFFSIVGKLKSFLFGDANRPYEKHRRIIQNQTLIQILFIIAVLSPSCITVLLLHLLAAFPSLVIIGIATWAIGSVSYVAMRLHVKRQNSTSRQGTSQQLGY